MRLKSPSSASSGQTNQARIEDAAGNDQVISGPTPAGVGKRSRPTGSMKSSLDYKPPKTGRRKDGKLITTKPGKRKPNVQQQQQQELQRQQQQQQRRTLPTRARGHSGPPPRRYDLSDLEGMDEEQLLQALYDDPDLAAAAAEAAEKVKQERESSSGRRRYSGSRTKKQDRYERGADGTVRSLNGHPSHLRELMDGGVPIKQWIFLLVLLGIVVYQLRKVFIGPQSSSSGGNSKARHSTVASGVVKQRGIDKGSKGNKGRTSKLKKPKKKGDVDRPKSQAKFINKKDDLLATPAKTSSKTEEAVTTKPKESKTLKSPEVDKKARPKKPKKIKSKVSQADQSQQPDSLSTNGSMATSPTQDDGERDNAAVSSYTSLIQGALEVDDGNGWKTVKNSRAGSVAQSGGDMAHSGESIKPSDVVQKQVGSAGAHAEEQTPKKVESATVEQASSHSDSLAEELNNLKASVEHSMESADASNTVPVENVETHPHIVTRDAEKTLSSDVPEEKTKKPKRKKKSGKRPETSAPTNGKAISSTTPSVSTQDDEAFALMLQKEEETLAKAESAPEDEETWEEVTTRKRKVTRGATNTEE